MVVFKEVRQGLAGFEGDQDQEDVAGERQIQRGVGSAMSVPVFLAGAGVSFVVVAVFHRPVPAHRLGRARLLVGGEAGEEVAGVAFLGLERVFLLRPVARNREGRTGPRQPGGDGGDRGEGPAPRPWLARLGRRVASKTRNRRSCTTSFNRLQSWSQASRPASSPCSRPRAALACRHCAAEWATRTSSLHNRWVWVSLLKSPDGFTSVGQHFPRRLSGKKFSPPLIGAFQLPAKRPARRTEFVSSGL